MNTAGAATAWHGITLMTGAQSELHCSELTTVYLLDGAGRCATKHRIAVVDPGHVAVNSQ